MSKYQHPPAFCPEHGLFPARAIALAPGVTNTSFVNVSTTCPTCGQTSEIIPGTYSAQDDHLNVLIDSSISIGALKAIKELAERAQRGEISAEEARKEAEKIAPRVGRLFDVSNWSDQAKATLYAAIIGAVAVVAAARIASSPDQNVTIQPVIERVIEKKEDLLSSTSLTAPTVPIPRPRPR